ALLSTPSRLYPYLCPCSRAPRAPPSFPTRRSSDLLERKLVEVKIFSDRGLFIRRHFRNEPFVRLLHPRCGRQLIEFVVEVAGLQDRKSTRLNSSHVKISYAVFCLKKKSTNLNTSQL